MKILDYRPVLYDNNLEMNALLDSEQIEFETSLKLHLTNNFKDVFVKTATIKGIQNYEDLLNITPLQDDTLEIRRERIFNRLISKIPFTEKYLVERINEILDGASWNYIFDYNNYELEINITVPGKRWYDELLHLCQSIIPCNIAYEINLYAASWSLVKENFATWGDVKTDCADWQEVKDGEWLS